MSTLNRIAVLTSIIVLTLVFAPVSFAAKSKPAIDHSAQLKISINNADAEMISEVLSGIGLKKAKAIVAYRKKNGKFKSLDDLLNVKGIGQKTLDKNRGRITL